MAQGTSDLDGPSLTFRNSGGYRLLWRNLAGVGGWLSPDDIDTYAVDTTYLDGVLVASTDSDANSGIAKHYTGYLSTWNIGDDPASGDREINAVIDDLAVFREKLTPQCIARIHSAGLSGQKFLSAFELQDFSVSIASVATNLLLSWDSSGGAPFYDVLSATNLTLPVSDWTIIAPQISSGGDATTYDASAYSADVLRFFTIRESE